MRIIVLNDYGHSNGGAAQVAIASSNALADAGFDVTFVSSVGPVDSSINRDTIKVVNFGFNDLLNNPSRVNAAFCGIWDHRCAKRFGELLNDFDPADTIIHLHTWVKSLSSSVVREAINRKFKLVCTLHDYFTVCPNGAFYNYQQLHQCDLAPMSLSCISVHCDSRSYSHKLWRIARHTIQRKFGHIPDGVINFIIISDYSEAILRRWLPENVKYYRVSNPIDIGKMTPATPSFNNKFTFIGRLSPEKGATLFAAAALKLNIKSVFVGSGPEEKTINEINPNAGLRGWQDRSGVIQEIRSSRAIVFPSRTHETQGLVVSEAAALGVPSIVSDGCAARDNIIDGKTGLLFRAGNVKDLASKLLLLNSDDNLIESLGKAAYKGYWTEPCTLERHVSELICCYKDILASNYRAI
ncbi:MAG: glycosyltransferase family 4 protein [Desulfuromonadales bacterium]|nr:glycosyltransferase family 4 protein [Desulfuromonadales bacterium]